VSREPAPFEHLLEVLNRHGVHYVVIGAFAAIAQGAPLGATYDIDFTPSRTAENLARLSSALRELDARIRVADIPEGLAFSHDADFLANVDMLNLTSSDGAFDLVFTPAAMPDGFEDLAPHAVEIHIGNQVAQAASLSDIIRSKEEAGREKDLRALVVLRQFVADQDGPGNG